MTKERQRGRSVGYDKPRVPRAYSYGKMMLTSFVIT